MPSSDERALIARQNIVRTSSKSATPHLSSSLSCIDIIIVLFDENSHFDERTQVYLSKGHAALAFYAALGSYDRITKTDLEQYCQDFSWFEGHVNSKIYDVPLSTGSLGHALPFAIGRAIESEVEHWVVMSDGELDEGSNWEAFLIAAHLGLKNLNVVIDRNKHQSFGSTESTVRLEPLIAKLNSFGWSTSEVDGHDHSALRSAKHEARMATRPFAVIANTVKGFGLKDTEENPTLYHYRPATPEHVLQIMSEM